MRLLSAFMVVSAAVPAAEASVFLNVESFRQNDALVPDKCGVLAIIDFTPTSVPPNLASAVTPRR